MRASFGIIALSLFVSWQVSSQSITLTITPKIQTGGVSQTFTYNIDVMPSGGFNQQVFFNLETTNLPTGFLHSFSQNPLPYPYTNGSTFSISPNSGNTLPGNYFIVVKVGNGPVETKDSLFLNLVNGICKWNVHTDSTKYYNMMRMVIDTNNVKWIIGFNGTPLSKFDGMTWTYYDTINSNLPSVNLSDIAVDSSNNNIWIATHDKGLVRFDGTYWSAYNVGNSGLQSNNLNSVAIDKNGIVWIGCSTYNSFPGGLVKYNGISWTLYNSSNIPITDDQVTLVRVDKQNNLWFVPYGIHDQSALCKYTGTQWLYYSDKDSCLPFAYVINMMAFDSHNNLWFTTGDSYSPLESLGLTKFDGTNWEHWNGSSYTPYNHRIFSTKCQTVLQDNTSQLPGEGAISLAIDRNDVKWFFSKMYSGAGAYGLVKLDSSQWQVYTPVNSNLPATNITSLAVDKAGLVWGVAFRSLVESNCQSTVFIPNFTVPKNSFKVFPNPTEGILNIELTSDKSYINKILVTDITGRVLKEVSVLPGNAAVTLDMGNYNSGVYLISAFQNKLVVETQKIIVASK